MQKCELIRLLGNILEKGEEQSSLMKFKEKNATLWAELEEIITEAKTTGKELAANLKFLQNKEEKISEDISRINDEISRITEENETEKEELYENEDEKCIILQKEICLINEEIAGLSNKLEKLQAKASKFADKDLINNALEEKNKLYMKTVTKNSELEEIIAESMGLQAEISRLTLDLHTSEFLLTTGSLTNTFMINKAKEHSLSFISASENSLLAGTQYIKQLENDIKDQKNSLKNLKSQKNDKEIELESLRNLISELNNANENTQMKLEEDDENKFEDFMTEVAEKQNQYDILLKELNSFSDLILFNVAEWENRKKMNKFLRKK
jgi:hypothetical protein